MAQDRNSGHKRMSGLGWLGGRGGRSDPESAWLRPGPGCGQTFTSLLNSFTESFFPDYLAFSDPKAVSVGTDTAGCGEGCGSEDE